MDKYLPHGQLPGRLQGQPILVSSMNDWFPIHLMPAVIFAMLFDYTLVQDISQKESLKRNTQDSVTKFKEGYDSILDHAKNIKTMASSQLRIYKDMWRTYILNNLLYPNDTLFIDFPGKNEDVETDFLFMWAGFVKPGKHRSLLYFPADDTWYRRDFFVDERENDLPNFANYENIYNKQDQEECSIMKDWIFDTPETLNNCLNHDEDKWGFNNRQFIKEINEFIQLRARIGKHMEVIKEVFLHVAARDSFPTIGWLAVDNFARQAITDSKKELTGIDIEFKAAIAPSVEGTQKKNTLNRYDFTEFLVRVAQNKFRDSKIVRNKVEAFEKLMREHIIPYHEQHCQDWNKFRKDYLLNTVIDKVMFKNKRDLNNLMIKFSNIQKGSGFNFMSAQELVLRMQLNLTDQAVRYCWGMSMMTREDDTAKNAYNKL